METTTAPPAPAPAAGRRSKPKVIAALRRNRKALERTEATQERLYAERLELFLEGRALDDKATQRELADAAGISDVAVVNAIKRGAKADG